MKFNSYERELEPGKGLLNLLCEFAPEPGRAVEKVTLRATALGIFDRIARHAGAGTLVPVTGFSNAVTSSAIDSRSEGLVLGVGAKIFTVAGPVILYGLLAGSLYGVIYAIFKYLVGAGVL